MEWNRGNPAMIVYCFTIGSIILWPTGCVQGSPSNNVTLSLQSDPPMVDVSGGSDGMVSIPGHVNVSHNGTDAIKVFLKADADIGSANLEPSYFIFEGGNESVNSNSFNITSRVPHGYTNDESLGVSVSGYFLVDNLSYPISEVEQDIVIKPHFAPEAVNPPPQEIGVAEYVYFSIKITNQGNSEDTYEFNIDNCKSLCSEMWTIATLTPKTFGAGETKAVTFSAQAPYTWTTYANKVTEIKLEIVSQGSRDQGGNVKEFVSLLVRERGSYIPGFTPSFAIIGIILVSLVVKKEKWMKGKPKPPEHPKDLYSELSMSIR
jgi:hypothetical protein